MNDLHTSLSYMDYHLADTGGDELGQRGGDTRADGARKAADAVMGRLMRQARAVGMDPDGGKAPN